MSSLKLIVLAAFLFAAGCGSNDGPSIYTYEVTVAAAASMTQETEIIKSCDIQIYETRDVVFVVGAADAAINRYIEIGHWRQITGNSVNIKRCIDYVP